MSTSMNPNIYKPFIEEILQLNPATCRNPIFGGCYLTVTELKSWGVQGFVQTLGENQQIGGMAFYRAKWEEIESTGGKAVWVLASTIK